VMVEFEITANMHKLSYYATHAILNAMHVK